MGPRRRQIERIFPHRCAPEGVCPICTFVLIRWNATLTHHRGVSTMPETPTPPRRPVTPPTPPATPTPGAPRPSQPIATPPATPKPSPSPGPRKP